MATLRDQLNHPSLVELYDYWSSRRRGRTMPARADIDPLDLPRHLPNVMLLDVLGDPGRFRYRLIGTSIVAATGEERTGRTFDEVRFFREFPQAIEPYERIVRTGAPVYSKEPFRDRKSDAVYEVDSLFLPLGADGERVDMVLVYFRFTTGPFAET